MINCTDDYLAACHVYIDSLYMARITLGSSSNASKLTTDRPDKSGNLHSIPLNVKTCHLLIFEQAGIIDLICVDGQVHFDTQQNAKKKV